MLDQLARHSLVDISVSAKGDLHIDDHHTVEDVGSRWAGAAAGARRQARLTRYADCLLPMDEALTRVRSTCRPAFLVFPRSFDGEDRTFDTELVREFFQALRSTAA